MIDQSSRAAQDAKPAGPALFFRKLRSAWSVGCGILCVLLIVFWVRSYSWLDSASLFGKYSLASFRGDIFVNRPVVLTYSGPAPPRFSPPRYGITSIPADQRGLIIFEGGWAIPYWLSMLPVVALGIAPWFRWRFSLRTLLIAATLVALAVGLVVSMVRGN
jgi:hypothetical protein